MGFLLRGAKNGKKFGKRWSIAQIAAEQRSDSVNTITIVKKPIIALADVSRIIEMAWEDRTPFDAIMQAYGLNESRVIDLMRQEMKPSSFRMWRKRVTGRSTKHTALRSGEVKRAYCPTQYKPK